MTSTFITVSDHTLLAAGLRPSLTVIDVGANHGAFTDRLSQIIPGRYYAVEANPYLIEELTTHSYQSVRHCAVTGGAARVVLHVAKNDEASSILGLPATSTRGAVEVEVVEVDGISLDALLEEFPGFIDIVKLDIEGAEVEALQSLRPATLRRVGQVTVEFHCAEVFGFDLADRTRDVIAKLEDRGFLALSFEQNEEDVLLLNREYFAIDESQATTWRTIALAHARREGPR